MDINILNKNGSELLKERFIICVDDSEKSDR
jgi:hypothetical protein